MTRGLVTLVLLGALAVSALGCRDKSAGNATYREQAQRAKTEKDPEIRARELIKIGYRQGTAHDMAGAEETLRAAWKDCAEIADPMARANAWMLMSVAQHKLGRRPQARQAAVEAVAAAEQIEAAETKARTLAGAAAMLGVAAEPADAENALKEAEKLAAALDDPLGKTLTLCAVAAAHQKIGQTDQRDRVIEDALKAANAVAEPKRRCLPLAEIALQQNAFEQRQAAAATFQLALDTAGKIEEAYARAYTLAELSTRLSAAGLTAKAREALTTAEAAVTKVPQPDLQQQVLEKVRALQAKLPRE